MGKEERDLHEYKDMQTSGFSLTPIKCVFIVPGVKNEAKKKEKEIWQAWKEIKDSPLYHLKPHASKDFCFKQANELGA